MSSEAIASTTPVAGSAHPVHRELALPQDAFLRRLPSGTQPTLALRLQGMVFAVDSLVHCLARIRDLTIEAGSDTTALGAIGPSIFSYAWTMVDQFYTVHQLSKGSPESRAAFAETIEKYRVGLILRNKFRHIESNLENFGKSKGIQSIWGQFSYMHVPNDKFRHNSDNTITIYGYHLVTIVSTPAIRDPHVMIVTGPFDKILIPTGHFLLSAFERGFPLEEATLALASDLKRLNHDIREPVLRAITEEALRSGGDVEELTKPVAHASASVASVGIGPLTLPKLS